MTPQIFFISYGVESKNRNNLHFDNAMGCVHEEGVFKYMSTLATYSNNSSRKREENDLWSFQKIFQI